MTRYNLLSEMTDLVQIDILPDEDLREIVFNRQRDHQAQRDAYLDAPETDPVYADEKTKRRWIVNYIAHEMASYDFTHLVASGKADYGEVERLTMIAILDKAALTYPQYAAECNAQQRRYMR